MNRVVITSLCCGVAIFTTLWLTVSPLVLKIAYDRLQLPLFTGFLTLSGFILSLKSNILLKLYADLFNTPEYLARVNQASRVSGKQVDRFRPLTNLGKLLILTVAACLLTSVLQVTLGYLDYGLGRIACMTVAGAAFVPIAFSWYHIRCNLNIWFEILAEKDSVLRESQKEKTSQNSPTTVNPELGSE